MTVQPRTYQTEAVKAIFADFDAGVKSTLLMAATGTGKTIMFLLAVEEMLRRKPDARIVIFAHREELIFQPVERAEQFWPEIALRMGIVMAERRNYAAQIVVATVQSLSSTDCKGAKLVTANGPIDLVISDEAHHTPSDTYLQTIKALGNPLLLGCTATPRRTDNIGLGVLFQKVAYKFSIESAIREGALVPFKALGCVLPVDRVQASADDESGEKKSTADLLMADNVLEVVFEKWQELASDRRTIFFCASVALAHATVAYFSGRGVTAEAVDGTTPKDLRRSILARYQSGKTQVLANMAVLTEGFDAPETACIGMLRMTNSDLVYAQCLGRGLRPAPGKADCLVIDYVPKGGKRDLIMAGDILEGDGLDKKQKKVVKKGEDDGLLFNFQVMKEGIGELDPADVQMVVLDYMRAHELAWIGDGMHSIAALDQDNVLALVIPDGNRLAKADSLRRTVGLTPDQERLAEDLKKHRLYKVWRETVERGERNHNPWQVEVIGDYAELADAQRAADHLGSDYGGATLASKKKAWRDEPMSDAQKGMLKRLGAYEAGLSKGQASQRIALLTTLAVVKPVEAQREREAARNVQRVLITPAPMQSLDTRLE